VIAAGAVAAVGADLVASPTAEASAGDTMIVGYGNDGGDPETVLTRGTRQSEPRDLPVFRLLGGARRVGMRIETSGIGLHVRNGSPYGVLAKGDQVGVAGFGETGVVGVAGTGPTGVVGAGDVVGVVGRGSTDTGPATPGEADGGAGVVGVWRTPSALTGGLASGVRGTSRDNPGVAGVSDAAQGVLGASSSGTGVLGQSSSGSGVYGSSVTAPGVTGQSAQWVGVAGIAGTSTGVDGASDSGFGVYGHSRSNLGVAGHSESSTGVDGRSTSGTGVRGVAHAESGIFPGHVDGVVGDSDVSNGVAGFTSASVGSGVVGIKSGSSGLATPAGVAGDSNDQSPGVSASSSVGPGLRARASFAGAAGVNTENPNGYGVLSLLSQRGALLGGKSAALRLAPSTTLHPLTGAAGDLFFDKNHNLWLCKGGAFWVQLG
jgi:hypothetical protein